MSDLTTTAAVKAYLGLSTTAQDAIIASLIARESKTIEVWTGRRFPAVTVTQRRLDGTGTARLMLPESPVISVALLQIDGTAVEESSDGIEFGYQFDDVALTLVGSKFPAGRRNVVCSWVAGYQESETEVVPSGNTPTLTPTTGGRAVTNVSVAYANGTVLTEVTSNVTVGKFSFADGTYTFNGSDSGRDVTMTYRYVPGPIEQACIDMVAQDIKQRDNIGIKSKSMAGEVITYSSDGVSTGVQQTLKMWRKVAPV